MIRAARIVPFDGVGLSGDRPPPPAAWCAPGRRVFVVVEEGRAQGRDWATGDVLVCGGPAEDGQIVVLEAQGLGRPRIGVRSQHRLLGEAGEPCSEARWRSAGKLLGVWRAREGVWVPVAESPPTGAGHRVPEPRRQLPLPWCVAA